MPPLARTTCGTLTIRIKQKVIAQYPLIAQQAAKTEAPASMDRQNRILV